MYKSSNNKQVTLDNVNLKEEINEMKGIAIMLEQDDGTYKESSTNTFPTDMEFNSELSGCIDNLGNKIENSLTYENGIANVETSNTSYCYLYFDKNEILLSEYVIRTSGEDLWDSTLEDDGYRFVGTNPDNYICFGTSDKNECINDTDKYMYRMVGVFEDKEGHQHVKLIKKEALNTSYEWTTADTVERSWTNSNLKSRINGIEFLKNITYMPSGWSSKITSWNYSIVNTLTEDIYNSSTAEEIYLHELNKSSNSNLIGSWEESEGKIGLLYISDFVLSLGSESINLVPEDDDLVDGWIHLNNNDSGAPSTAEWTMARYGYESDSNYAWAINDFGMFDYDIVSSELSVRPTFYLNSEELYNGGTGTINDPILLENPETATNYLIENVSNEVLWKSTLEDDGYRFVGTDPDNYICFGTTDTSTCTNDTDKYMYRIIGIFDGTFGYSYLKLIKKEALNTSYAWNADYENDVAWNASDLYNGINGSYFLNNTTYSYMQNSTWTNKIATWNYTATNTKTYESSGMNYYSSVVRQTYLHEMNRSTKTSTVGVWDTVSAKIGLMYVSDYQLSLGSTALDYTNSNSTHYASMKTGWMHISNNDSGAPSQYEWTMSRYGVDSIGRYAAWYVRSDGGVSHPSVGDTYSVRPVFYLTSDVTITGEGSITNPYIIS